jgi:hypothetical protein
MSAGSFLKMAGKKPRLIGPEITKPRAIKNDVVAPHHTGLARTNTGTNAEATAKTFGRVSNLTAAQREQALALIASSPDITTADIAKQVGCNYDAVRYLRDKMSNHGVSESDFATRVLKEYSRRLVKSLPISRRVKVYTEIAKGDIDAKRAFSALKALQRIEELEGIVTKKEQKEAESKEAPQANGPVFVIQGATINVGLTDTKVITPTDAIDVTPIPASGDESEG